MHGLMSYRRFGRARSVRSDRVSTRARSLRSDRAEHVFGRCVAILFEFLSDDSRFLRKVFRKSICRRRFLRFYFGDLDINFVATVFEQLAPSLLGAWISSEIPMRGMASSDEIGVFGRSSCPKIRK
ncbi:hypothetical protein F2Q68_00033708 [Brassica cretica]|uniref:Uncharacterized protein n=1 Tax=Brassica cretica TaxID=69181 RepID=A0A8S9H205_BRACR|nr:hypothetical protein F2Q68_00033708 [Brassica cretica]